MKESNNPLMEINTSFSDYLVERTRSYQEHVVGGTLDYAFDADFALRQKIASVSGWSRLYKTIVSADIPGRFKKYFQTSGSAGSLQYTKAYNAAKKCSERLQIGLPVILVRKSTDGPEIISLAGEGIEPCIVMTSDIAESFTSDELLYLIGCECGRLQNRHSAFNFAFTYPGITRGDGLGTDASEASNKNSVREMNYLLNKWLIPGDITADRAGVICLDDPVKFPQIYASVRRKGVADSLGVRNTEIDIDAILARYETLHITPIRDLNMDGCSPDERRISAAMEFIGCEILYIWRPDLQNPNSHTGSKQSLEIRCDIIAAAGSSR